AIFELALYWQDVNAVYSLNNEINSNVALVDLKDFNMGLPCPAVSVAQSILEKKDSAITLNNPGYSVSSPQTGTLADVEPFALYKIVSANQVNGNPQVSVWVDCRSPFENGIVTQVEFYHKTLIMKASIPRFDKPEPIVIIPDNIFISSPKLVTSRHY
ncbi:MAG TPA: hypothetical protein PKI94_07925, partial [Candidatus Gastranaerophilaceae bacterium]|nr:hypothetical protein [Candidatus Gastranaerophilaceae bacterium]